MPPQRSAADLVLALLAVLAAGLLTQRLAAPPPPLGRNAAPERFSAERALDVLAELLADGLPHPAGTRAHDALRARLVEHLRALGLEVELQERLAEGAHGNVALCRNVLARRPAERAAETDEGERSAIALFAHYDSVGASPGAGDDGSGVACLLEIARALRADSLRHDLVLVLTDAEEVGLIGARAFLEHPWARELGVALNLEARGTEGPSLMFESSPEGAWLIEALARSSPRPRTASLAELVYKTLPNDTDFSMLQAAGIEGLNFAFIGGFSRYHGPRDELALLSPASVQHQGEQALALVRELDALQLDHQPALALAWTDVAGRFVLRWRRSSGPFLALGALLVAAAAWARSRLAPAALARALGASALAVVLALAAGLAPLWLAARLSGAPDPALAQPWPLRTAMLAALLAGCLLGGGLLAARAGARALLVVQALVACILALVCALELGEVLPLVLPSATAAALGALLVSGRGPLAPGRAQLALLLPLSTTCVLLLPLLEALEDSFGFALPYAAATPAALAVCSALLVPALASLGPRAAWKAALGCAALALLALVLALLTPAHDARHPARLNLRFVQDESSGGARWDVSTYGLPPPSAWRARGLRPAEGPPFPWLHFDRSLWVAPAPRWELPPPRLELLDDARVDGERRLRARLSSPRGATRLHLHRPPGVELVAVRWREQRLELERAEGASTIFLAIPPADGLELELLASPAAGESFELWMLDQDWAMPPAARDWEASRPPERTPFSDGDVSILGQRFVVH